jgi:hypothetical protein
VLQLDALHTKRSLFRGFVLLEIAADALEVSGASRAEPVEYDRLRERRPNRHPGQVPAPQES